MREFPSSPEQPRSVDPIDASSPEHLDPHPSTSNDDGAERVRSPLFDQPGNSDGERDAGAEASDAATDSPEHAEPAVDMQESPDRGASADHRDRPCEEFRQHFPGEYTETDIASFGTEPFRDPREVINDINPHFDESPEYKTNCADCARSFERTWRGDFEEAAGHTNTAGVPKGETSDRTEDWAGTQFRAVPVDEIRDELVRAGHGSSAIVHARFRNYDRTLGGWREGGHAYNVVNYHGTIRVVDSQTHSVSKWADGSGHPQFQIVHTGGRVGWSRAMGWDSQNRPLWP